jgi:hypothetical protein
MPQDLGVGSAKEAVSKLRINEESKKQTAKNSWIPAFAGMTNQ